MFYLGVLLCVHGKKSSKVHKNKQRMELKETFSFPTSTAQSFKSFCSLPVHFLATPYRITPGSELWDYSWRHLGNHIGYMPCTLY